MTGQDSGNELPPDEDKERRRKVIENVLVAFRPQLQEEFGDWVPEVPDRAQALQDLADIPSIGRLLKHRLLIDGLRRTPGGVTEDIDAAARNVLASTIGRDDEPLEPQLREAKQALDDVVTAPDDDPRDRRMREQHWAQWVQGTRDIFNFTTEEETFTACDDERTVRKRPNRRGEPVDCRLIIAQFWSDRPPAAFIRYVDPANWPSCSAFWTEMRPLTDKTERGDGGYDRVFRETVVILGRPLSVPLEVAFRVRINEGRVWTRFNIAPGRGNAPVDVDTGLVSAQLVPGGPAQTLVRATKYLHWKDSSADFSKLACDFGYSEFMIQMAEACLEPSAETAPKESAAAAATGPSVDAAVSRLVEEVVTQCGDGIRATGPHLERLIGRFTGRSWDARWINDLLDIGLVTVNHYGNIASSVRRFADALRDADDREDGHE